ncbi:MAG: TonB-dependent receptor [Bryobacteraceae bacterium]
MLRNCAIFAILATLFATSAWGQGESASSRVNGTVTDPNKSAVPGAKVTLSNDQTGFTRVATTSDTGAYTFTLVPPGTYQIKIEKEGFSAAVLSGVLLTVGQATTIDLSLALGTVTQTVQVEASSPMLSTGSVNLGSEVTSKQVIDLPLNIRNVFGLVSLDSSVNNSAQVQALNPSGSQGNADQDIAFFNFGGGRFGTTAFLLDGHWNGAGDWAGIIFVPSVDELQEFRIQTHTFSPQYGWSMGNVVNAITKSGSRTFHGSGFEFARNSIFDANNFFNNKNGLDRTDFKRNQFGFTAGGPLYIPKLYRQRDKTFLFGAYEGLRQQTPTTLITTVPTDAQRQGDFSKTFNPDGSLNAIYNPFSVQTINGVPTRAPFAGNQIPSTLFDPVALKALAFYPAANRPGTAGTGTNNFVGAAGLPTDSDQYTVRADHNINDNQRLFGRWSQKRQFKQLAGEFFGSDNPGGNGTLAPNNRFDGALGYSFAIGPTLVLNANAGIGRWVEGRKPQGVPFNPSSLGLPNVLDSFGGPGAFPSLNITNYNSLGSGGLNATPREARTYSIDLSKVKGSHSFSFGFMAVDLRLNTANSSQLNITFGPGMTQGPSATAGDPNTGNGMASFLLGTGSNNSSAITLNALASYQKSLIGWYANDEWKLKRNLTVNLGLRYDYQTAPTDRFDRLSYWTLNKNPISDAVGMNLNGALEYTGGGNQRGVYNSQHTNWAPRIGITYNPMTKLVMRAGFGLFYTPAIEFGDYEGLSMNGFTQSTPYVGSVDGITPTDLLRNPFPKGLLLPAGKAAGALTNVGQSTNAVLRGRPTPYVEQWTYGLQYEVLPQTVLEASYVGNHGVKLLYAGFEMNSLDPTYLSLGNTLNDPVANPFYGHIAVGPLSGPTIPRGQLLRPYPQFDSVSAVQPPSGMSTYQALNLSLNRRFSQGLQFLVTFTASKYLATPEGNEGWAAGNAQGVRNWYDTSLEKSLMSNDIPKSFVSSFIYELPVGTKKKLAPSNKIVNGIIGNWQVSGVMTLKSGFPLAMTTTSNNTNSYGGNQRPNQVADPHVSNPTLDEWFNTAAFVQPAAFTFGSVPRTMPNLRSPDLRNLDATLQKNFPLGGESRRLQIRAEFYNFTNHTNLYAPNTQFGNTNFGVITGSLPGRSVQLGARFDW